TNHHDDLARMARQEHRRLSGGIAGTDQHDLLLGTETRLDRRGPVPNAATLELVEAFDLGPPVACAARHHDGARANLLAVLQREREGAVAPLAIERFRA